jgi:hypothetical protein
MKKRFKFKSNSTVQFTIVIFIMTASLAIAVGITRLLEKEEKSGEAYRNTAISFFTGISASGFAVLLGVKKLQEHINEIKKDVNQRELEEFWKNSSATNSSKFPQYTIILVVDNENNVDQAGFPALLDMPSAYACYQIMNTLKSIYNDQVKVELKTISDGKHNISGHILEEHNLIFLGMGSSSKTIRKIGELMEVEFNHIETNDANKQYTLFNKDKTTTHVSKRESGENYTAKDFGVIMKIDAQRQMAFLFNGSYRDGMVASVMFATSHDSLKSILPYENERKTPAHCAQSLVIQTVGKSENVDSFIPLERYEKITPYSKWQEDYAAVKPTLVFKKLIDYLTQ